jgi:hypothetical protein
VGGFLGSQILVFDCLVSLVFDERVATDGDHGNLSFAHVFLLVWYVQV